MKFSFDLDQILISHVRGRGMTNRRWQRLAELIGSLDANECQQRWELIHNHTNIEYKCLIPSSGASSEPPRPLPSQQILQLLPSGPDATNLEPDHDITIHVRDESRQTSRDFICSKRLLLSEMSYFQHYLESCRSTDEIDISVHCDVHIFDWLMKYIEGEPHPEFASKTIVSILISSDFLKMSKLVDESIRYFVHHADEIIQVPIDLSCINNSLMDQLANLFTVERLHRLKDPTDKILSSLYKFKVKHLLELPCNQLFICTLCGSLFTASQYDQVVCYKAKIDFDAYGQTISRHQRDTQLNWDVNLCLTGLRAEGMTWMEIFWKFWAVVTTLLCSKCGRFRICDFSHCRFHGCDPVFTDCSDLGRYQCCKVAILKFDTMDAASGCQATSHVVNTTSEDRVNLEIMLDRRSSILIPFSPQSQEIPLLSRLGLNSTLQLTSKLMSRTTMLRDSRNRFVESTIEQLVQVQRSDIEFGEAELNIGGDGDGLVLSDNSSDDGLINPLQVLGSGSGSDDETNRQTMLSQNSSHGFMKKTNITFSRRHSRKKSSKASISKISVTNSPAKHRIHKLDSLRDDDRARMHSLVHKLADMRKDKADDRPNQLRSVGLKNVKSDKVKKNPV